MGTRPGTPGFKSTWGRFSTVPPTLGVSVNSWLFWFVFCGSLLEFTINYNNSNHRASSVGIFRLLDRDVSSHFFLKSSLCWPSSQKDMELQMDLRLGRNQSCRSKENSYLGYCFQAWSTCSQCMNINIWVYTIFLFNHFFLETSHMSTVSPLPQPFFLLTPTPPVSPTLKLMISSVIIVTGTHTHTRTYVCLTYRVHSALCTWVPEDYLGLDNLCETLQDWISIPQQQPLGMGYVEFPLSTSARQLVISLHWPCSSNHIIEGSCVWLLCHIERTRSPSRHSLVFWLLRSFQCPLPRFPLSLECRCCMYQIELCHPQLLILRTLTSCGSL